MDKKIMNKGLFYSSNFDKYFTPEKAGWYVQYKTESGDYDAIRVDRKPINNEDALLMLQEINKDELWDVCFFDEVKKDFKKFLVIGHARHGKDTFAEILEEVFGLKFKSSSQAAVDIFIYDALKK